MAAWWIDAEVLDFRRGGIPGNRFPRALYRGGRSANFMAARKSISLFPGERYNVVFVGSVGMFKSEPRREARSLYQSFAHFPRRELFGGETLKDIRP